MNQNKIEISKENVITKKNEENTVKIQKSPKLSSEQYHKEEIEQNKMIVKNAIFMIWIGILLIIASFIVYVCKITDTLVAGTICGCFIDLFSGIGGFHQAMSNLDGECVLASEIDESAIRTYKKNYNMYEHFQK